MTTALCPGSFDPPTNGHVDVIERAIAAFDRVVVAVVDNPAKESLFSAAERISLLEDGVDVVVKGLRTVDDYEYEMQMSQMNRHLTGMETVFMATRSDWSFISSSLVKEVAKLGGSIDGLVPRAVEKALQERLT